MFSFFANFLSSIASFLFPIFASYKALKSSDPAQLTPWLMYWVVFSCGLLVESWVGWFLFMIPFYSYIRLFFLLYLVLPQTQGARFIYETHVHPFLRENEGQIEDFISDAHDRLRVAGLSYVKKAIELVKTNVLGLPPSDPEPEQAPPASAAPQSYTHALLARFSVPAARWTAGADPSSNAGADFYSLLAGAVSAATSAAAGGGSSSGAARDASGGGGLSALIPQNLTGAGEKMSFIAAQRERLNVVLGALDREAQALQREESLRGQNAEEFPRAASWTLDGSGSGEQEAPTQRASSGGYGFGDWNRNRSESDFENVDAESGAEEVDDGGVRRRAGGQQGSWMPWGWGGPTPTEHGGTSSGRDAGR